MCCVSTWAQINTDQVMKIGRNALYFEDYVLSIQYFNQVVAAKPHLAEPYFYRSVAKISLDDYKGAEQDASLCIERNPFIVDAYQVRGVSRQNTGRFEEAIADYEYGLKLMPEDKNLLFNKAVCELQIKRYDASQATFERLLKLDSKNDRAHLGLAQLCLAQADTAQALVHVNKSLELNHNNVNAFALRSEIELRHEQDFKKALADMDEAIKLEPQQAGYFVNRAYMKYKLDDYFGAMADYDYAVSLDPENMAAHYNRAMLHAEVGEHQKSIADFSWVLKKDPNDFLALYNRAMLYMQTGQYRKAVADYDRVLTKYPKFEAGYMARSDAKRRMGDTRGSEADLNQAVAIMKRKGTHKSDFNPADTEVKNMAEKAKQQDSFAQEAESQDEIMSRFNQLLTVENKTEAKTEYSNRSRGHVQNTDFDIQPEEMFSITYYGQDNKLNGKTHYMREMTEVNDMRILPLQLALSNAQTALGEDDIRNRFSSIAYYDGLLATSTPRAVDYLARAVDYLLVKNPQAAIADADRALAMSPDFVLAMFVKANARALQYQMTQKSGTPVDATTTADQQAALMLREQESRHVLDSVLVDFNRVLKLSPRNVYAHFNKGCVYMLMNDYTAAISAFSNAIDLKPDLGEAFYNRGLMYLKMGNKELGLADLSKAGELGILPSYNVLKRMNKR